MLRLLIIIDCTRGLDMKIRLADYIADFVVNNGITECFTVVGG